MGYSLEMTKTRTSHIWHCSVLPTTSVHIRSCMSIFQSMLSAIGCQISASVLFSSRDGFAFPEGFAFCNRALLCEHKVFGRRHAGSSAHIHRSRSRPTTGLLRRSECKSWTGRSEQSKRTLPLVGHGIFDNAVLDFGERGPREGSICDCALDVLDSDFKLIVSPIDRSKLIRRSPGPQERIGGQLAFPPRPQVVTRGRSI
ncbi:hypothetical protein BDW66DRAFT_138597 [Aspergillus desertorum]